MKIKYIIIIILVLVLIYFMKNGMSSNFKSMENKLYTIAYELGVNFINLIKNHSFPGIPTVMFDIDDTLLYVNDNDTLVPIKPIIKLLNYARKNKMKILIITARDSIFRDQTINDLKINKINYDYLYLRETPKDNYQNFKSDIKFKK